VHVVAARCEGDEPGDPLVTDLSLCRRVDARDRGVAESGRHA